MTQTKEMSTEPSAFPGRATASRAQRFFTNHETRNTNHGLFFACFGRQVVRNAGYSNRKPRPTVFHESRDTTFCRPGCATGGATGNRRPDHCPRRQAAVSQFTIVHHCSLLFAIVQKKILPCASSSQTVLLGANQDPTMVFTKHESRDTKHGFFSNHRLDSLPTIAHHCPLLPGIARGKILSCASILAPPGRCFPARCGAARAAMARHGRPPSPAPATRLVRFSRITRHKLRNMVFPCPSGDSKESNPKPDQQVFHESRDTAIAWRAAQASANSKVFTKHESRLFFESRLFCFPTHHFPPFPTISRYFPALFGPPHPPTDQGFARRPPFWASLRTSAARRRSRRPPGCFPLRRKIDEPKLRKEKV